MKATRLLCCFTTVTLLTPASLTLVRADDHRQHASRTAGPLPDAVRQATERFRNVNEAIAAGYVLNGGCVSGPAEGAMGVHYAKFDLFDNVLDVEAPEVLVYEPTKDGKLRLVAAEYVTPYDAWHAGDPAVPTPQLMGHLLNYVAGPNRYGAASFYELHVWAWKDNPNGAFADWNTAVSCAAWGGGL